MRWSGYKEGSSRTHAIPQKKRGGGSIIEIRPTLHCIEPKKCATFGKKTFSKITKYQNIKK